MKRILLTTTSLVLAAGVAQADITFSGATGIAIIDDNGASMAAATGDQACRAGCSSNAAAEFNADTNADTVRGWRRRS